MHVCVTRFFWKMDERLAVVFLVCLLQCVVSSIPDDCQYLPDTVKGPSNDTASYIIGGMFAVHQQKKHPGSAVVYCSLDSANLPDDVQPTVHRFSVEQTEALALAVDSVNANGTLLNGKTLGFAIRDTCGLLSTVNCPEDLGRYLVSEDDVTATVVGPFYDDGDERKKAIDTVETIFRQLSNTNPSPDGWEGHGVFPLLDIPELPSTDSTDYRQTVRYVSQSCALQARAAVDFLVEAGWQDIILVTSSDNCGFNISREFNDIVRKRECNFKRVVYFEERPSVVVVRNLGPDEIDPTDISKFSTYEAFQSIVSLNNPETIVVLMSSIPFAYTLLSKGFYETSVHLRLTPEQKKNFTFLLGDFWGEPGEADLLYELVKDLVRDSAQVVSLRTNLNGYEKFQHHMASLTSSSPELRRNKFLGDYWSEYFNCTLDVNCSNNLRLPAVNRPILWNTAAILVIDAVYAAVGYIQQFYEKFPLNRNGSVVFNLALRELTVESWTGNTVHLDRFSVFSYVQPVEWKYDILILKSAEDDQLDTEQYGQWIMQKDRADNITVNSSVSVQLWRPKQFVPVLELCPASPSPASPSPAFPSPVPVQNEDMTCSADDVRSLVALPVLMLVLLCVMGLAYGMTKGWISAQESILEIGCFLLLLVVVTAAAIVVSILIATDAVSSLSCDSLVADFFVNVIGCMCYVAILTAVLAKGIGKKLKLFRVKVVVFFVLVTVQIIVSSVASFGSSDKQGNKTDDEYCVDMRDRSIVYVSYWYNTIIALIAAFIFLATFSRVRIQKKSPPSCVTPVLGLILAVIYAILVSLFLWTRKCRDQIRLLVVLAAYPAILAACMLSRSALSECCKRVSKRRASIELPEGINGRKTTSVCVFYCVICPLL